MKPTGRSWPASAALFAVTSWPLPPRPPRPPDPLRPPLAGAGAVPVHGEDVLQDPAGLHLAGHGGRAQPLRRALLQGLPARPRRRGLAAGQLRLGRRGGRARQPLDRHRRRARPVAAEHGPRSCGRRRWPGRHIRVAALCDAAGRALDRHPRRAACCGSTSRREPDAFAHDAADAGSLADDRIYALHVDGKGRLWVGTDGGLDRLDAGRRRLHPFRERPRRPVEPRARTRCACCSRTTRERSGSAPPAAA